VVELHTLPTPSPLWNVRGGSGPFARRLGFGRQMLVEEGDELRAKGLDIVVERQLHQTKISST
jgi:hypothetical protein